MIVSVAELKVTLGIDESDTSQDAALTQLIERATAWVQGETHFYFDTPELFTEIVDGTGERKLYLTFHIDPAVIEDESAGELAVVRVRWRVRGDNKDAWEELVEDEDWERRGGRALFALGSMYPGWNAYNEFELTYPRGYVSAPDDIKALITELAAGQYGADQSSADGTLGIVSERIGDFSYQLDGGSTGAAAGTAGGGVISDTGWKTLMRWKKQYV